MEIDCGICRVRSWRRRDREPLVRQANNVAVWRNLRDRFPHPYTDRAAREWIAHCLSASPELDFAIDVGGEAVGGIGLQPGADVERFSAEIGYWLGEPFWGRGIATAALRGTVAHALRELELVRIFALPFSTNLGSARVLEKAGFSLEGILRSSAVKEGRFLDQRLYAITRGNDPSAAIPGAC